MSDNVPIIDFGKCGLQVEENEISHSDFETIGEILYRALKTSGFAHLTNHGISQDAIEKLFRTYEEFFQLPSEEKNHYVTGTFEYGGYEKYGIVKANPERECDVVEAFRSSRASEAKEDYLWPNVPGFKDEQMKFIGNLEKISMRLLRALGIGIKLKDPEYFCKHHDLTNSKVNSTQFKCNRYPPITHPFKENQIRMGEHTDKNSITLVFPDGVQGLQFENMNGDFVDIESIPGTAVLNIGEMLELWSGNRLKATVHRVVPPEDPEVKEKERKSLVYFVIPNSDTRLEELEFSGCESPKIDMTAMTCKEYMDKIFESVFVGFSKDSKFKQSLY